MSAAKQRITVVGMGASANDISLAGAQAIDNAQKIILKTQRSSAAKYLAERNIPCQTLDKIYDTAEDFDILNTNLAEYVAGEGEGVVYCVDGAGYDDASVAVLARIADVNLIAGISKAATACATLPADGYLCLSATRFLDREVNAPMTVLPLVIYEIDDRFLAGEVKLKLMEFYPHEAEVYLCADGVTKTTLADIDRQDVFSHQTSLILPPKPFAERDRHGFGDLIELIKRLRDDDGCEWDREQTHKSIRANAIEEAYELVEAVDLEDDDKVEEECGDVILQGLFHAIIAEQSGEFTVGDALSRLANKLISRHTHIFGKNKANSAEDALGFWETAKAKEKGYNSAVDRIAALPVTFSALMRAVKVQKIARKTGFEFASVLDAYDKLAEEIAELKEAGGEDIERESGDVLFAATNVIRMLGVDPEVALNASTAKFERRFSYIDECARKEGRRIEDLTLQQMEEYYNQYKKLRKH